MNKQCYSLAVMRTEPQTSPVLGKCAAAEHMDGLKTNSFKDGLLN